LGLLQFPLHRVRQIGVETIFEARDEVVEGETDEGNTFERQDSGRYLGLGG